jgi:outer membrane receptor protein involved in Fe transport
MSLPAFSYAAIEEVIVTANKREQNFNDVGSTMSVLSSRLLVEQQISSLDDIAASVPSLTYARSDSNTPIYTLRGIGFNESSLGVYPAVSVYLDQAPLTFPALPGHSAFDLERIEVLKGPQGTLFGQNSTGGAINLIAAKPSDYFDAGFHTTYGRFDLIEVEGFLSGPLTDTLNGRVAVKTRQQDEWQSSITRDAENGEEDLAAGRLILQWLPSDQTELTVTLSGWNDESDPQALQLAATKYTVPSSLLTPNGIPIANAPLAPEDSRAADWGPADIYNDREMWHGVINFSHDFADNLRFTSLSSYIDFDQQLASDRSGANIQNEDLTRMEGSIKTFSQEFRVENTDIETLRWVVGVNYEDSEVEEDETLSYINNTNGIAAGGIFQNGIYTHSNMENWAVFGNVEYNLTSDLVLKLGTRYTDSEYEFRNCNYDIGDGGVAGLFNYLGSVVGTTPFDPVGSGPGECFILNFDGVPGEAFTDKLKEDNISWRVGLDYNVNDDILAYANISKGHKQGSFPTSSPASWIGLEPVTQESVLAYEIGAKSLLLDGRMQFNTAVFLYTYEDKQVRGTIPDLIFETLAQLRNIPESEVKGAEVELVFSPVDNLNLSLSAVYLDTEITKAGSEINTVGDVSDYEGSELPFTSQWSTRFDVEYTWSMAGMMPFIGLTYTYDTEKTTVMDAYDVKPKAIDTSLPQNRYIDGFETPFIIDDYGVLDMRAGIRAQDESWSFFLWGKNVTDEYYWHNVTVAQDNISRAAGMPATYGLTFTYKLN